MTASLWLQAVALLLWGAAAEHLIIGASLSAGWLALARLPSLKSLSETNLVRLVEISSIAVALTGVGSLVARGLPAGLLALTGWLPVVLLPLAAVARAAGRLRVRHLAFTRRRSKSSEADRRVDLGPIYLALTLLAAATLATPSHWFFWAMALFMTAWFFLELPRPRGRGLAAFSGAATLALAAGFGLGGGLEQAHLALEEWAVDSMLDTDDDPYRSRTRIGELGRMKLSDRIVWRVEQQGPARVPLLLRDGVYTLFDGQEWIARHDAFHALPEGSDGRVSLWLRGATNEGKAILPLPAGAFPLAPPEIRLERNSSGLIRISEAPPRIRVAIMEGFAGDSGTTPWPAELAVPRPYQTLLARLPELNALVTKSERERLAGLESWFARNFRYTLFLGDEEQGGRDLERFLTRDRAGHCEYFATATVVLLRSLKLPARYVTGYSLQEFSPLEKRFIVRQRHAHAWAEAFVDGRWVEVDTTPGEWVGAEEESASAWQPVMDLFSYAWLRVVEVRDDLLKAGPDALPLILAPVPLLLVIWLGIRRMRHPRAHRGGRPSGRSPLQADPEQLEWVRIEQELAALGLGRRVSEPPRAWLARIALEGETVLEPARMAELRRVVDRLYRRQYRDGRN